MLDLKTSEKCLETLKKSFSYTHDRGVARIHGNLHAPVAALRARVTRYLVVIMIIPHDL